MVEAPLCHNETVVGVFKIASPEADFLRPQHVAVLRLLSDMIFSARYEADERYHRASHDLLTGLANRALFYDRLRQALARRGSSPLGILKLDMDGLKAIDASIGLALFPEDATEWDGLVELAERSLHAVKRSRKSDAS